MLDKQKDQLTVSILERLRKKGIPKLQVPSVIMNEEEDVPPEGTAGLPPKKKRPTSL